MTGNIRGMGKGATAFNGPVRITLTSTTVADEELLRALFSTWFEGYDDDTDAVLENRLEAVFERRGWKKP